MDFKALAERLGIEAELTEENALDTIGKAFDEAKTGVPDETAKALEDATTEAKELKAKIEKQDDTKHELTATERVLATRLVDSELSTCIAEGRITPVVRDAIRPQLIESDMLLATKDGGDPKALKIIEGLKQNDLVKLGEQTKRQVVAIKPDAGNESDDPTDDAVNARIKAAHGK